MIHRTNYLRVRAYLEMRREVDQVAAGTIVADWSRLRPLLEWADDVPFEKVAGRRPTYPHFLQTVDNNQDGKPLTAIHAGRCCNCAKLFFEWCRAEDPAFAKALPQAFVRSLRMARPEGREQERDFYSIDDVRRLCAVPGDTVRLMRDRAAVAMLFLSAMRVGAFVTMPIEAIDLDKKAVRQWPELGMKTKYSKAATTYLLPVPDLLEVVTKWDAYVRANLPGEAMWFDVLDHMGGLMGVTDSNSDRRKMAARSLRLLCAAAGVPYRNPHKLRHAHTVYAISQAATLADLKAVSQNLMHSSMTITDKTYSVQKAGEVADRISNLGQPTAAAGRDEPDSRAKVKRDKLRALLEQLLDDEDE